MTINLKHASFYVLVGGRRLPIHRSVTHRHDARIHAALGTTSEAELQAYLDQLYVGDWFGGEDGSYKGEDGSGLGVETNKGDDEMIETKRERYTIYKAPGWHGDPDDPVIAETDDEQEAALRAGCRIDLGMPGDCNPYDAYAIDNETGDQVERNESYCCDECGEIVPWGDGPTGAHNGRILECAGGMEKHLVTWLCDECAEEYGD